MNPGGIWLHLALQSVAPVLDLGIQGTVQGQYGLVGRAVFFHKQQRIRVLVRALDPKHYCYRQMPNGRSLIVAFGDANDPYTLLYGCGAFATEPKPRSGG